MTHKYHRLRDTRNQGGIRMSVVIHANSAKEADAIFEERWRQRTGQSDPASAALTPPPLPEKPWLTPAALELKRKTPMFTIP